MNDLEIKYNQEADKIRLLWNKFYDTENSKIFNVEETVHIHTPPALVMFFDKIVTDLVDMNELDDVGMVNIMDFVFKFGAYFGASGFSYNDFTKCECTQITSDDIELMEQGIV